MSEKKEDIDFETAYRYIIFLISKYKSEHGTFISVALWTLSLLFGVAYGFLLSNYSFQSILEEIMYVVSVVGVWILVYFIGKKLLKMWHKSEDKLDKLYELEEKLIWRQISPQEAVDIAKNLFNDKQ